VSRLVATILNVDDLVDVRDVTSDFLRDAGYHVIEASNGAEALAKTAEQPDLVILDVDLPDMSGIDVCRMLKSRSRSTPVLMLSGVYTSRDDQSSGLESGADGYLTKPITQRELVAAVHSLLRARRGEEETRRRARLMQQAHEALASALLNASLDLPVVLERLGAVMRMLLDVDAIRFRLTERDGSLRLVASIGDIRCPESDDAWKRDAFAVAILNERRTLVLPDAQDHPAYTNQERLRAEGVVSTLAVPMYIGDDAVGVVSCWSRVRRDWTADDVALFETAVRHAAVAIQNARLYAASERQRRSAEQLAHVARLLLASLRLETISEVIARSLVDLLGATGAVVFQLVADGSLVTAGAFAGAGRLPSSLPPGVGTSALALKVARTVTTTDALADPRIVVTPELDEIARRSDFRSVAAVPLVADGQALGTLAVFDAVGRAFTPDDIALLETFADQAAIALQNARLYAESERRRRVAETLVDASRALGGTLDIRAVVELLGQSAVTELGTESCGLAIVEEDLVVPVMAHFGPGGPERNPWDPSLAAAVRVEDFPVLAEVVRQRQTVAIGDTAPGARMPPSWIESCGTRAALLVPLVRDDDVFGVLTFGATQGPRSWQPNDVALASALGAHAALAITNARLFAAEQRAHAIAQDANARLALDIMERNRQALLIAREKELLEMVAVARPLPAILDALCRTIEALSEGTRASLLLLDADGVHLRRAAAPSLPSSYLDAVDGAPIGPRAGSSGTAAYLRTPVIVSDVAASPLWSDYRDIARAHGIRAVWAMPVFGAEGAVLGTLTMHDGEPRHPGDADTQLIERFTHLAGIAIERDRARTMMEQTTESLRRSEARYRALVANTPGVAWAGDEAARWLYASPRIGQLFGYTAEEVYREGVSLWKSRIHRDDADMVRQAYQALFTAGTRLDVEYRVQCKDGRWIWIRDRAELIVEPHGVRYASGVLEDITERKQATGIRELLLNQVITVQEEERKRIARELHDDTAQSLASLRLGLDRLRTVRTLKAARADARLLHDIATRALHDVRRLSAGLRPAILDDLGLEIALSQLAADFEAARGITIDVTVTGDMTHRLPPEVEIALYRIAQEALANVARHAGTPRATLVLTRSPGVVTLLVSDDGGGFTVQETLAAAGANGRFGLHNIAERAAVLHGTADISSSPGHGTQVSIDIPLARSTG